MERAIDTSWNTVGVAVGGGGELEFHYFGLEADGIGWMDGKGWNGIYENILLLHPFFKHHSPSIVNE